MLFKKLSSLLKNTSLVKHMEKPNSSQAYQIIVPELLFGIQHAQ